MSRLTSPAKDPRPHQRRPSSSSNSYATGYPTPPGSARRGERSLRSLQMLQVGQNLTSVINSPSFYESLFKMPPLPPPPPELAAESLDSGKEALRRYRKIMGPYANSYAAHTQSNSKGHGTQKKAEQMQQAEEELRHCLKTVPDIYFSPEFSIRDKEFFTSLSERKDKMVLQDKLSYYLDLVEVNLLKQICLKSSSVFAALQTIQRLHSDVAAACRQIKSIRENMKKLHDHLVLSVTNVLRNKRRKQNIAVLKEKLQLVATVVGAQPTVQILVSSADFSHALDLISSTKDILHRELEGVACVQGVGQRLDQQEILIEKLITSDFTKLALGEHATQEYQRQNQLVGIRNGEHTSATDGLRNGTLDGEVQHFGRTSDIDAETKLHMTQLASNALQMRKLTGLVRSLQMAVNTKVRTIIKAIFIQELDRIKREEEKAAALEAHHMANGNTNGDSSTNANPKPPPPPLHSNPPPPTNSDTNAATSSSSSSRNTNVSSAQLDKQIKTLTHQQFASILRVFFPSMLHIVRRLASVEATIRDAKSALKARREREGDAEIKLNSSASQKPPDNNEDTKKIPNGDVGEHQDAAQAESQFKNLLSTSCEIINSRGTVILEMRRANYKSLRLKELREIVDVANHFVKESETICKKRFYGLRGTLNNQTKIFLEAFHTRSLNQLVACLEGEQWAQADVPREFQDLVDREFKKRIQSSRRDGVESKSARVIFFAQNGTQTGLRKFAVVSSTLILLKMISAYIDCASQLKDIGTDVLNKLITLLQIFNSKSCGLVLGAAAIQTAGLKNINVTHLSLVSQSLGLVVSQIPVIRAALASQLPEKQLLFLDNFNNVQNDYRQHQEEIFKKLVQIIQQLAVSALNALAETPWMTGKSEITDGMKLDKGIKKLMGQTASMHNKLTLYIDQEQRDKIFSQIAEVFSHTCKRFVVTPFERGSPSVRKKISIQIQHILSRLRGLSGLGRSACKDLEVFIV